MFAQKVVYKSNMVIGYQSPVRDLSFVVLKCQTMLRPVRDATFLIDPISTKLISLRDYLMQKIFMRFNAQLPLKHLMALLF